MTAPDYFSLSAYFSLSPFFTSFAVVVHLHHISTCIHPAGKYDPVMSSTLDSPRSRRHLDRRCIFLPPVGFLSEVGMLVSSVDFLVSGRVGLFIGELLQLEGECGELA
jgi:hypothetical protein